jgi:hypothetical protein
MSAAAGTRVAFNATVNLNTGSYGSPTWTPLTLVGSVKMDISFKEADASTRGSGGREQTEPTLLVASIDFDLKCVPSDPNYVSVRTSCLTRGSMDLQFSTIGAATSGEFTFRDTFKGFKFGQDENLDGIIINNVTVKPCFTTNPQIFAQNA